MNFFRWAVAGALLAPLCSATAQSVGSDYAKAWTHATRGHELLKLNRFHDAIVAFREAIRLKGVSITDGYFDYPLAQAQALAGFTSESLSTYKKIFRWDALEKDLYTFGPSITPMAMDYAILLAKCGRKEDAKALYYFGLRSFSAHEPFPFLVVFDPDPQLTVWPYTPEKLIAAATMAKAQHLYAGFDDTNAAHLVHLMEPNWVFPIMFLASRRMMEEEEEFLRLAAAMAKTREEKTWIKAYRARVSFSYIARALRASSIAFAQSKSNLQIIHSRIATTAPYPSGLGNDPRGMFKVTPQEVLRVEQARAIEDRGELFMELGMHDEAISVFRRAIHVYSFYPYARSEGFYNLAKALSASGQNEAALAAYRRIVGFDDRTKELSTSSSSLPSVYMDYAILLARCGRVDDAKMVYYSALRTFNLYGSCRVEPFPLVVVFDPDPTLRVWEFSIEKFTAAALLLKSSNTQYSVKAIALMEQVLRMEPDWVAPMMFLASRDESRREHFLAMARRQAVSEEDRTWVNQYTPDPNAKSHTGNQIRKASAMLNRAKTELERNWRRVAGPTLD